jgi:NAD(P)-dependent dehydrogenase (short-subunit alcohol dehydrogenase family)
MGLAMATRFAEEGAKVVVSGVFKARVFNNAYNN